MKIRNIIDRNEVIWFSLMALPLRLVSTFFTKKYENYTLGSVKLSYILWEYSIFTIFLIFVYGIMLKKTARETTGYAKVESSPKIPLIRSFFIYLGIGEVLNFIACLIPYSITMFGRYTAYPAYALYRFIYGTVSGRMGEINAGNIIFADYIFYILCYSVYLVLFTYLMYLTAKSAIKVKYRYA